MSFETFIWLKLSCRVKVFHAVWKFHSIETFMPCFFAKRVKLFHAVWKFHSIETFMPCFFAKRVKLFHAVWKFHLIKTFMPSFSKKLTASCSGLGTKWRQCPFELKSWRSLSYAWNHSICSAAYLIFKEAYSFMWCFRCKMKAISVETERLQNTVMCMNILITAFVQRHGWFSKKLTTLCGVLGAKWRQHPLELKAYTWNHNFCWVA